MIGKSFLLSKILVAVRLRGDIALAVASCRIFALLLMGGRTAHSRFKIGIDKASTSTCRIPVQSDLAELLRRAALIVWDEAPMMHRYVFEALNRTLSSLLSSEEPFGEKVVLQLGDFRQVLPVVPRATLGEILACVKKSPLWRHFVMLRITMNMRVRTVLGVQDTTEIHAFADFLHRIGEGRHDPVLSMELRTQRSLR